MDPLSDILNFFSAKSYITAGLKVDEHWARAFSGFDGFKLISVQQGKFWFRVKGDAQWLELKEGQGIIITRFTDFEMATNIDLPVLPYISSDRAHMVGDDHILLAGRMDFDTDAAKFFIASLPTLLQFNLNESSPSRLNWFMQQLYLEKQTNEPGSKMVCDYLIHLIIIDVVRSWLKSNRVKQAGWMNALSEPKLIKALSAIHNNPSRAWNLILLAEIAGMSRSNFARKFKDVLGLSPLQYVNKWRIHLACNALQTSDASIKSIALSLGYASESSFCIIFKRAYEITPSSFRKQNKIED